MANSLSQREDELRKAEDKVRELVKSELPGATPVSVTARGGGDHDGDPSLFVQVVLKDRADPMATSGRSAIRDRLRTWLITTYDDDRFPYFDFVGDEDLQERESAGS